METINRLLIQCTTPEDAGRIESRLEELGIDLQGESLVNLWEVFRSHTMFKVHNGRVEYQSDSFYNLKREYEQYDILSADDFLKCYNPSKFSFKRLFKSILFSLVFIVLISVIMVLFSLISDMLPVWVNISIVVVLTTVLMYYALK